MFEWKSLRRFLAAPFPIPYSQGRPLS